VKTRCAVQLGRLERFSRERLRELPRAIKVTNGVPLQTSKMMMLASAGTLEPSQLIGPNPIIPSRALYTPKSESYR